MKRSANKHAPKLYVTAADFALTTWEAETGEASSGKDIRRIGLTPPWDERRSWKRLVRGVLKNRPENKGPGHRRRVELPVA